MQQEPLLYENIPFHLFVERRACYTCSLVRLALTVNRQGHTPYETQMNATERKAPVQVHQLGSTRAVAAPGRAL